MKTYQANLINSLSLIIMPIWAWIAFEATIEKPEQSETALIPVFLGMILIFCEHRAFAGNKIIKMIFAHIAVLVTLIALIGLTMPLKAAILDARIASIFRVVVMFITGVIAMITFIKSFIQARKNK